MGTWIEINRTTQLFRSTPAVVPLVGTWIEIRDMLPRFLPLSVVPLVGTWIEIQRNEKQEQFRYVVPLVGTWIEIIFSLSSELIVSRAPRGHVD